MTEEKQAGYRNKRQMIGVVITKGGYKTVGVKIETLKMHPRYKKYIKISKKFMAHDEKNEAGIGDKVLIVESKPISATKKWRMARIVERSIENIEG